MAYLLSYTRLPINEVLYDPRIAYSMHLALSQDGVHYTALNHNSGVLFGRATENADGSLNPKTLKSPWIFRMVDGSYGVLAVRCAGEGEPDEESKGQVFLFRTKDFLVYSDGQPITLDDCPIEKVQLHFHDATSSHHLYWLNEQGIWKSVQVADWMGISVEKLVGVAVENAQVCEEPEQLSLQVDIEGAVPQNVREISQELADRLQKKLLTPVNIAVEFPEEIQASNEEELNSYRAKAIYSDGTSCEKRVDWDLSRVDFSKRGTYNLVGQIHQDHYEFPVAFNRADPCIGKWQGKYYFIATNDADGNHTLYIREADSIPELVDAPEHLILDSSTYEHVGNLLWAPEFHEINGRMFIFHAATPQGFFWEESHVMELREGGNPICKEDWSKPMRVVRKDGSDICEAGKEITLDMTCFEWQGRYYVVWSQRQFVPKDLGAWLYIAELNPQEPWKLLSDPVVLSKPDFSWANNHTFVEEGPFALISGEKLYVTFSGAGIDTSYVVSYLSIEKDKDLLVRENWFKNNYPILTSRSVEGEFGTGHNAYVQDEYGDVWNTYHARPGVDGVRSSGIRRVHFDVDGAPMLDVTEEKDLAEGCREVRTRLVVE